MIKKLRRKFIIVIMSVVTVIIAAAFIAILSVTINNLERQSLFTLNIALAKIDAPPQPNIKGDGRRMPTITVVTDENNTITHINNQMFNFQDNEVEAITKLALSDSSKSGVLREYNLRYLVETEPNDMARLAFVDISMDKSIIENLLATSALIGVSTLLIFFVASIFLARWFVRPVELAWNSQRQFIADASHELKTPLTVILSNVEMLTGDNCYEDAKTSSRLENILDEAKCMKVLLDDMLSIARSDGAQPNVTYENVNLSELVNNCVLIFEPILFDAGKRFEYIVKDELFVTGDVAKLRQLIEILLDNALRYSLPNSLITVSLKSSNKNDINLEVTNECETIPKVELSRIFERFYRLDKSRSSGGYGLGLSIAESIVRGHGGKIWAKSENQYMIVCVTFPNAK